MKFLQSIFQSILDHIFPATFLYVCLVIGYVFLYFAGLTAPFDQIRQFWGGWVWLLDVGFYAGVLLLVAWFGTHGQWRINQRWIVQSEARRGLFLSQLPLLDLGLIVMCVFVLFYAVGQIPDAIKVLLWLIVPLLFALLVSLVNNRPGSLDAVVAEDKTTIEEFARSKQIDIHELVYENTYDPSKRPTPDTELRFAQIVRLPAQIIKSIHFVATISIIGLLWALTLMISQAADNAIAIRQTQTATTQVLTITTGTMVVTSTPTIPPTIQPSSTPTRVVPTPTATVLPTPTASPTSTPSATPTPTTVPSPTATSSPTTTPTPEPTIGFVEITGRERLNVRQGPGANSPLSSATSKLGHGAQVEILNTAPAGQGCGGAWYQVRIGIDQSTGWVCSDFVRIP